MVSKDEIELTEEELRRTRAQGERLGALMALAGLLALALFAVPIAAIGGTLAHGAARWPITGLIAAIAGLPIVYVTSRMSTKQSAATAAVMDDLRRELREALHVAETQAAHREAQAKQQEFESQLANALEMADGEPEVIDVVERAFSFTMPGAPAELLLADNSHAHLSRMAVSDAAEGTTMCSVDSPDHCPAARRAQVQRFPDSEALDACPKLRSRASGACSAVCVPVSIMGRTVGVIHATGAPHATPDQSGADQLGMLAKLAGARIGLLRMVADTQLQAATDSLTGLLNRRSFENRFRTLRATADSAAVVMVDLDHFKHLNDTYGHDTGDRALRLFAQTVSSTLRSGDLACRHGGEEFALVLPTCSVAEASLVIEKIRASMVAAVGPAGLPAVTASFGIVEAETAADLSTTLARADAALFAAKAAGRDCIVVHGADSPAPTLEKLAVAG